MNNSLILEIFSARERVHCITSDHTGEKNDKGEDKTESRSRIVGHFRGQSENGLVMGKWRQVVVKSKFGSIRSIFLQLWSRDGKIAKR